MRPYGGGKPIFNEGITPIGLICHLYHDRPQMKTKDRFGKEPDIDPETGIQKAEFKVTLAWSKTRAAELQEMADLARKTQAEAWPESMKPGAFFSLEPFFRDGDDPAHNTEGREYLRGRYYLNFKSKAKAVKDKNTGQVTYIDPPGLLGPYGPEDVISPIDIWPGCTGRVSFTMFGTEYMGKHFISTRLQNIQKYDEGDGTRIGGGGRPDAAKQFGAIKDAGAAQGGFGLAGGGGQPAMANPFGAPSQPAMTNPFGTPQQQPGNMFGNAGSGRIF